MAMSRPRLTALLLALATLLVYLPVTRHAFLSYDDDDYVTNNPMVQQGLTLAGVGWAFTTFHAANWHPLTWLSHMADCEFFNLNAGAHHFVNALFHAANAALLFVLLWRLTGKLQPAALVAALFAWHPLHVESVAWVAERKDVLSVFFALLALLSYAKFARANSRRSYWFALVFFALGLLAKPMLVTLPFVLLLLDYWPLGRISNLKSQFSIFLPLLREKIPFFLLAAASCVVTPMAQRTSAAVVSLAWVPLDYRLENATVATARYLLKMLWPADLAVIYPPAGIPGAAFSLALAALVLISVAVWRARGRSRCWLVGWLWFLGTLVPVIGLVQVGGSIMADRYTYLPSIGVFVAVVFGLQELPWARKIFPAGAVALLIACVLATERQLAFWRDTETLFRHTLAVTRNNEFAHLNLGRALDLQGRTAEAVAEYREAERINPAHCQVYFATGNLLAKMGRPAEALAEYRECLRRGPEFPALHNAAACALAAQGNLTAALAEFAAAERLDPSYPQPHLELAKIYLTQGRDNLAVDELRAAVRAAPEDVQTLATATHYLAANANAAARDANGALVLALKANDLSDGRQPEVFDVLGMAFAATGDFTNAVISAQNALEFAPPKDAGPLRRRLELYQNHQPWRESFAATNANAN
jgi:tetratricopeptide (TPR) repeat protein